MLTPSNIVIDGYKNLTSLDLINIPDNKSFTAFEKIMSNYYGGIVRYKWVNTNNGYYGASVEDSNSANLFITIRIPVPQGR